MTNASAAPSLEERLGGLTAHAAQRLREARRAIETNAADAADRALADAAPHAREHPEFLRLLGITRHLQKRRSESLDAFRRALERQPGDALILTNYGTALRAAGERAAAEAALRRACELAPNLAAAWYNLGKALAADARADEASEAFARALDNEPAHLEARLGQGDCLRTLGRIGDAAGEYRRALATHPACARAWSKLANLKTIRFDAADGERIERLYADPAVSESERIVAGFALLKAFEDQNRYDEAAALLLEVNARKRRLVHWNAAAFSHRVDAIATLFATPPATACASDFGSEVIFIVSLPRSGSTLTEQILASHPHVEGANELDDLAAVIDAESRARGVAFPRWTIDAKPADWQRLGQAYLDRTARWRRTRVRFTDKALSNWLYTGAALAMLPGARFVNVRRDPVETCLSCLRQLFGRGHGYTYDVAELASFWREYDRLTTIWRARYPERTYDLVYERLLESPEEEIRSLLEFCDLPFDPACLRFHETRRGVRTPSSAQVREPLRRDTARAHRYAAALAPLRAALGR